jgi:glycosyltransferase involved in cell wall biosynthesis
MKLVYLSELRLPTKNAHGFQIMNMCAAFSHQGVEVELLVPWRKNLLKEEPFAFYSLPPTFKIRKIFAIDLYPLRFIPEKLSHLIHLTSFMLAARLFLFFHRYDVLYTREPWAGYLFRKLVVEIHMPEHLKQRGFAPDKVIVLNEHIKKELVKSGFAQENILVAPDAVDLKLFPTRDRREARVRTGLPQDKPIVLYGGNFKKWKGVNTLAEAAPLLSETLVVMIGGTKENDVLSLKEKTRGLSNVIVEGFKPQEEFSWYLAAADVLVLPNTAQDENSLFYTSPLKLFEYMASERPIAASDLPSVREVLNEGNAVFFEPDNSSSLAEAVRVILQDGEKARKIALRARHEVEGYTWDTRAKKILDFVVNKAYE